MTVDALRCFRGLWEDEMFARQDSRWARVSSEISSDTFQRALNGRDSAAIRFRPSRV